MIRVKRSFTRSCAQEVVLELELLDPARAQCYMVVWSGCRGREGPCLSSYELVGQWVPLLLLYEVVNNLLL